MTEWRTELWIDDDERSAIEYAEYWNDEAEESRKPFNVDAYGFGDVEQYLAGTGLPEDLRAGLKRLRESGRPLGPRGVDLAAGTLWAVPLLLAEPGVEHIWCVEYSRHRLLRLGPKMLEHYGVDPERVTLALGSFYELRLPDASLDFAFLSQAFHHADDPACLLRELSRVLAERGRVLIIGEHRVRASTYGRYAVSGLLAQLPVSLQRRALGRSFETRLRLRPAGSDLKPPDPVLGDHTYTTREYGDLFESHGFEWIDLSRRGAEFRSFVLTKATEPGRKRT